MNVCESISIYFEGSTHYMLLLKKGLRDTAAEWPARRKVGVRAASDQTTIARGHGSSRASQQRENGQKATADM